jgi:hypothetical protein
MRAPSKVEAVVLSKVEEGMPFVALLCHVLEIRTTLVPCLQVSILRRISGQ